MKNLSTQEILELLRTLEHRGVSREGVLKALLTDVEKHKEIGDFLVFKAHRAKPPRARVSHGLKGRTFGNNPEPLYPPLPATEPSAQEQIEALTKRVEALERRLAELLEGEK